jgi:hypothetical protein
MRLLLSVLTLILLASGPGQARAATVYLNDGAVIQAQRAWRGQGTIYVQVNRDVLLEFAPAEVNLRKTVLGKSGKGKRHPAHAMKKAAPANQAAGGKNAGEVAAPKTPPPEPPKLVTGNKPAPLPTTTKETKPAPPAK